MNTKTKIAKLKATLKFLVERPCADGHDCDDDEAIELISEEIERLETVQRPSNILNIDTPHAKMMVPTLDNRGPGC